MNRIGQPFNASSVAMAAGRDRTPIWRSVVYPQRFRLVSVVAPFWLPGDA